MGNHGHINHEIFPFQSERVGTAIETSKVTSDGATPLTGKVVRDDLVSPFVTIAAMEDDSVLLAMGRDAELPTDFTPAEQTDDLGRSAVVVFWFDKAHQTHANIVRDDAKTPDNMVLKLENGKYVLGAECQYSIR